PADRHHLHFAAAMMADLDNRKDVGVLAIHVAVKIFETGVARRRMAVGEGRRGQFGRDGGAADGGAAHQIATRHSPPIAWRHDPLPACLVWEGIIAQRKRRQSWADATCYPRRVEWPLEACLGLCPPPRLGTRAGCASRAASPTA